MNSKDNFEHQPLKMPDVPWGSLFVDDVIELEKLRGKKVSPSSFDIFLELKVVFHSLENWASARIEGNQTKLIDALDPGASKGKPRTLDQAELNNLRKAINFIDDYCRNHKKITISFIREVHKIVTEGLPVGDDKPGDSTPGKFRIGPIRIGRSKHIPPSTAGQVTQYIDELVKFINLKNNKKNDILKAAIVHHRSTWIHPFNNGNGRVSRLITYAMLQMMGYGVANVHILNPSAVFGADRQKYYDRLAVADHVTDAGLIEWAEYFASGLREEIGKIDRLLDDSYIKDKILQPVVQKAYADKRLTEEEFKILMHSFNNPGLTFTSGDINRALNEEFSPVRRSRLIKKYKEADLIQEAFKASQKYVVVLLSPQLHAYVSQVLRDEGFVPPEN